MKTLRTMLVLAWCIALASTVNAQVSQVVYAPDGLSGELQVRSADCVPNVLQGWDIILPANKTVQVTRINNTHFQNPNGISICVDDNATILAHNSIGTFKDTLVNAAHLIVISTNPNHYVEKDPMFIIRFAVIDTNHVSSSTAFGGNVDIFNGMLNVTGSQAYMGSNVSAVLGGNYSDYTCFGSPQGGRIRGSNDGYLILEANPNGYGNKNVYINRYVAGGNILMTSSTGKVGIGTDDPKHKLDVNGTIHAHGILVTVPEGADFVFGEDYQLRPLNEVNAFIQENKHLPEIQSAADMQQNGVSVNDFQIQLLQKIEELTLYIIQQDQQIQELKQQVNELKK